LAVVGYFIFQFFGIFNAVFVCVSLCLIDRLHFKEALALWLQAFFTLACASLALMLPMPKIWTFALMALMPTCLYVLWRVAQACQAQHSKRAWVLLIVFVFLAAIGLRDFIAVRWQSSGMDTSSYLPHAMFVFVLVMAGMIVNRYSLHFQQAKQLSEHLSEEVDKKEAQIKHAYELINEQTRENAMILERQRMMSDIHDGVGAQLVSLVNQTQKQAFNQDQVREQASAALDELRIAVDALQPSEGDLLLVLATLRYRLEPRLKACGIELIWVVEALPNIEQLGSHRVIQIQRIVYQAISNIIEHSKATQVVMSASLINEQIALTINDNGCGFDINTPRQNSVGLQSMAHRAKDIDAVLTITSGAKGTNITLTIAR
jgi:signal transduction histidine kinase